MAVIRWKQLGSLQHALEESCLIQEGCDVRFGGQPSASWPRRRCIGREQAGVAFSLVWLWAVRVIALLEKGVD